jgi:hypothetical protein
MAGKRALDEPRLDQLFAEPIVQQLMHRDRIDEATTRRLMRETAVTRSTPRIGPMLALPIGLLLLIGIRRPAGHGGMGAFERKQERTLPDALSAMPATSRYGRTLRRREH